MNMLGKKRNYTSLLVILVVLCLNCDRALPEPSEAETPSSPSEQRVWKLGEGDDLQRVLAAARPGDTIELAAGVEFKGNFRLPAKRGNQWIVIRTTAVSQLPPPGQRVRPDQSHWMAKIVSPNVQPAIQALGAHHIRFLGIEITTEHATRKFTNWNLIFLGQDGDRGASTVEELPHDIIFERCYIHGTPTGNVRRGVALNGANIAVMDCHLSDFHEVGADAQAICGWNGTGPFHIINNYLEGAGENIMFGGGLPAIRDLVPSDIVIRGNHLAKPNAWRAGHPDFAGIPWTVKNLLELKNGRRVLIEGNVLDNCWVGAQHGFAIVLTPRSETGRAPWVAVQDVTIRNNIIRNAGAAVHISSGDTHGPTQPTKNILIEHNLMHHINRSFNSNGTMLGLVGYSTRPPIDRLTVRHNTFLHDGKGAGFAVIGDSGKILKGFTFTDNIVDHGQYGLHGSGAGVGTAALVRYGDSSRFANNLIIESSRTLARLYPADNFWVATTASVGFRNLEAGDFQLAADSRYAKSGTDGGALGANMTVVQRYAGEAISGRRPLHTADHGDPEDGTDDDTGDPQNSEGKDRGDGAKAPRE